MGKQRVVCAIKKRILQKVKDPYADYWCTGQHQSIMNKSLINRKLRLMVPITTTQKQSAIPDYSTYIEGEGSNERKTKRQL